MTGLSRFATSRCIRDDENEEPAGTEQARPLSRFSRRFWTKRASNPNPIDEAKSRSLCDGTVAPSHGNSTLARGTPTSGTGVTSPGHDWKKTTAAMKEGVGPSSPPQHVASSQQCDPHRSGEERPPGSMEDSRLIHEVDLGGRHRSGDGHDGAFERGGPHNQRAVGLGPWSQPQQHPPSPMPPPFRPMPGTFTCDWLLEGTATASSPRDLSRSLRNAYGLLLGRVGGARSDQRTSNKRGSRRPIASSSTHHQVVMEEVLARPQACFLTILPHDPPRVVVAHSLGRYYAPSPCGLGETRSRENPYRNRIVAFFGEREGAMEESTGVGGSRGGMGSKDTLSSTSLLLPALFLAPRGNGAVSEELFGVKTYRLAKGAIESRLGDDLNSDSPSSDHDYSDDEDDWLVDPTPPCDEDGGAGDGSDHFEEVRMTKLAYIPPHWAVHFLGGMGPLQALRLAMRLADNAFPRGPEGVSSSEREATVGPLLDWLRLACQADENNPHRSAVSVDWAPVTGGSNDPAVRTYASRRMRFAMQATQSAALASAEMHHRPGGPSPPMILVSPKGPPREGGGYSRRHPGPDASALPAALAPTEEDHRKDVRDVDDGDVDEEKDRGEHRSRQACNGLPPIPSSSFEDDVQKPIKINESCSTEETTTVVVKREESSAEEAPEETFHTALDHRHQDQHDGEDGVEKEPEHGDERGVTDEVETNGIDSKDDASLPAYEEEEDEGAEEGGEDDDGEANLRNDDAPEAAPPSDHLGGSKMDSSTVSSREIRSPSANRRQGGSLEGERHEICHRSDDAQEAVPSSGCPGSSKMDSSTVSSGEIRSAPGRGCSLEGRVIGDGNFAGNADCDAIPPPLANGSTEAGSAEEFDADSTANGARNESSEGKSVSAGQEPMGCLQMNGIPFATTKKDIMNFFDKFQPIEDSILLDRLSDGRASGKAYVKFPSHALARAAFKAKEMKNMQHRYIRLLDVSLEANKIYKGRRKKAGSSSSCTSASGEATATSELSVEFINVSQLPTQEVLDKLFGSDGCGGSRHKKLMTETNCRVYVRGRGQWCKHYPFREGEDSTQLEVIVQGRWANLVSKAKRRVLDILHEPSSSTSCHDDASYSKFCRNDGMQFQDNSVAAGQKRRHEQQDYYCDQDNYYGGRYSSSYGEGGSYSGGASAGYYQGSEWTGGYYGDNSRAGTYSSSWSPDPQYTNGRSYGGYPDDYEGSYSNRMAPMPISTEKRLKVSEEGFITRSLWLREMGPFPDRLVDELIGRGGEVIRNMRESTFCHIDIDTTAMVVKITGKTDELVNKAVQMVQVRCDRNSTARSYE